MGYKRSEFGELSAHVLHCLRRYPRTRDCDTLLVIRVLERIGLARVDTDLELVTLEIPHERLGDIPSLESISRIRRMIQERGRYLPSREVGEWRRECEGEMVRVGSWFWLPVADDG